MFISTKKRSEKINVPRKAVSMRLTRILQSQTVKQCDVNSLQYDDSDDSVVGRTKLDQISDEIDMYNRYADEQNRIEREREEKPLPEKPSGSSESEKTEGD